MSRSVEHATFVIERTYDAAPARVFAAWADPAAKARWFGPPEKPKGSYTLDFRVGGSERLEIAMDTGPSSGAGSAPWTGMSHVAPSAPPRRRSRPATTSPS
jgi:uncharacterized protein YndB with AHSA1/START domain